MKSEAKTTDDYIGALPEDRREAISALRKVIRANLPDGYVETMSWGMIAYEVPLAIEPNTYNGKPLMFAALASQKNHMALYLTALNCVPGAEAAFAKAWTAGGRKLDMGKACIRFKRLDDLDLKLIGKEIAAMPMAEFVKRSKRAK
jgi:uncharacterized protein YdhG (YjbR/CyaY superfamily)